MSWAIIFELINDDADDDAGVCQSAVLRCRPNADVHVDRTRYRRRWFSEKDQSQRSTHDQEALQVGLWALAFLPQHLTSSSTLLAICRPSGCTVVSGVVVVVVIVGVGVCNRSQMRTSKCTCLIFGVNIGLDPGEKCTKGIFARSKFKVTRDISPTMSGWLLVIVSAGLNSMEAPVLQISGSPRKLLMGTLH